jgi:magnesium chelatase subunit D
MQNNPLFMALAGAVLNPGLRTILIYDAPYHGLQQIASYLSAIESALDHKIVTTQLGSTEHDDDLWGYTPLPAADAASQQPLRFKPLLFSSEQSAEQIELMLIPNLAEISLAVARASTMLMGTNVVHLERHERHEKWQPQQYWIASCAQDEIGSVSAHLVDRFALRLSWKAAAFSLDHQAHIQHLQQQLADNSNPSSLSATDQAQIEAIIDLIKEAQKHHPQTTSEAITAMLDYIPEDIPAEQLYHRHEITLARYAVTVARIMGTDSVNEQHVADAARLMGINRKETEGDDTSTTQSKTEEDNTSTAQNKTAEHERNAAPQNPGSAKHDKPSVTNQRTDETNATQEKKEQVTAEVHKATITPLMQSVLAPENPYLEDSAPILHEEMPLRLPMRYYTWGRVDHGSIIGVEKGSSLRDIAIISTIFHAALFSKRRQLMSERTEQTTALRITQEDLHHYRRAPSPEHMLLLLLDYTSLKRCDWQEALLPYLSWAYTRRASISIVKVGAQDARHELQAEVVSARNIQVPSIGHTLEISTGRTTPLAHGMQLALQTLQRNLQHGRNTVQHVMLVVISDGRGNVPLQASINKHVTTLVTREGIGDALKIAQEIREIKHVERILLNPQPTHYAQLPIMLADALGASIEQIPPFTTETGVFQ